MRPLDYSTSQPDGLYVRCICGAKFSAHNSKGGPPMPFGAAQCHRYEPDLGKPYPFTGSKKIKVERHVSQLLPLAPDISKAEDRFYRRHALTIPTRTLAEIAQHAEDDHPHECCGFIFSRNEAPDKHEMTVRIRNIQRVGYAAYLMDPLESFNAINAAERMRITLKVIYHSHPGMSAFFSQTDRESMTSTVKGQPDWPDCRYIVMGTNRDGQLEDARAYQWNPAIKDFSEITLKVE